MDQKFFSTAFALNGDKAVIPEAVQPDGAVSFDQGFTFDYERELGVDPDAKAVPRDEVNGLYYDITDNIGQYQRWGAPEFITSADNGGVPYPYGIGAQVVYTLAAAIVPAVFVSLVTANATTPDSAPANWQQLGASGGIPAASTTVVGVSRYATNAETLAKALTTAALTPSNAALFAFLNGAAFTGAVTGPSFTTPSDERLKDDVKPFKAPAPDLQLMSFLWNERAPECLRGTEGVGVIAQHVEALYPWCVKTDKHGTKHVDHGLLAVTMILAGRG